MTAGEAYQVSAYLRGELDVEDSGGAWLIRVSYYNAGGTRISYHDVYTNSSNSFTGWQEKGDLTVAPAGAVSMTVAVWNYMNSSWIGFDDVRVTAVSMKKYYYAGGQRVAMREGAVTGVTGLSFLFGDHLGSTSVTASSSGTKTAEVRYKAWGEDRYTSGTMPTSYRFTGQRVETEIGLYYYGARYYDPLLSRWTSPDSIIPQNQGVQAWDRYAYVNNNPVKYRDPTGHDICDEQGNCYNQNKPIKTQKTIETHSEEYFAKALLQSPLHGVANYGNFLAPCTTAGCTGIHPGIDSQNIWGKNSQLVNWEGREIYPAAPGVVAATGISDWGNYVMIEHRVGYQKYYSIYAHLLGTDANSNQSVQPGDEVSYTDIIGFMSNTTDPTCPSCSSHLHFEIRKANNINLSQGDPFNYQTWWPQDKREFHQKWVDLSPFLQ